MWKKVKNSAIWHNTNDDNTAICGKEMPDNSLIYPLIGSPTFREEPMYNKCDHCMNDSINTGIEISHNVNPNEYPKL